MTALEFPPAPTRRVAAFARSRRAPDAAALGILVLLAVFVQREYLVGGTIIGQDTATQYFPFYAYLGERLAAGDLPMWTPSLFSGAPFLADPLSGWMYWPVMLLFTTLPIEAAAKSLLFLQGLLAGVGLYALARVLGIQRLGALAGAVAYSYSGFYYIRNLCCLPYANVYAWTPLVLAGVELSLRSRSRLERAAWLGGGGFALSQVLAGWVGQGSYYALLVLGGYVFYRTVVSPPTAGRTVRKRITALFVTGAGVLLFGFALGAAALLPGLEFNAISNLAQGYSSPSGGWPVRAWASLADYEGRYYAGASVLTLAVVAPFVVGRRHAAPYWLALCATTLVLSGQGPTLLHTLLYNVLPRFESLHTHGPERVILFFFLGSSLLAGAAVGGLASRPRVAAAVVVLPVLAAAVLDRRFGDALSPTIVRLAALAAVLVWAYWLLPRGRTVIAIVLTVVVFADLALSGHAMVKPLFSEVRRAHLEKVSLDSYYDPRGASKYLLGLQTEQPFRYFGYGSNPRNFRLPYTQRFYEAGRIAIEVNNRAIMTGLEDVQGYNPTHVARYDEFITALNGRNQDYHDSEIFVRGLSSPLLPLLNARYIVVASKFLPRHSDMPAIVARFPTVYNDGRVRVLENPNALPRAWLVHSARRLERGAALKLLASGQVNPRQTVLLEAAPPTLAPPRDLAQERVVYEENTADGARLRVRTTAPAMLVLSEVYTPQWRAYVDGRPAPVYVANHAFRAVAVPTGEHIVELRYESPALALGLAISGVGYAALAGLVLATAWTWRRRRTAFIVRAA